MAGAQRAVAAPAWRPFVRAALLLTVTAGALTGALDLWSLRVTHHPVPLDHHRGHALAQVFGFVALFVVGLSLQLAPTFFGVGPPSRRLVRGLQWLAIGGVGLVVVGRLGALVPGSPGLGLVGATALVAAFGLWGSMLVGFWRDWRGRKDALQHFMLAGAGWWLLAAVTVWAWQLGQTFDAAPGLLRALPLEAAWAMALLGGAGSWILGLFFRAGVCTLKVKRAPERAQHRLFLAWQPAVALAVGVHWVQQAWFDALGALGIAAAVALAWWTVRPFSGKPNEVPARAVQAGFVLLALFAALEVWGALAVAGVPAPPLLRDATRHCLTFGVSLFVFGFAGRMVPGFARTTLRWPRAYEAGVVGLALGGLLRLSELFGGRLGPALAGASGGLALIGVTLLAAALVAPGAPPKALDEKPRGRAFHPPG